MYKNYEKNKKNEEKKKKITKNRKMKILKKIVKILKENKKNTSETIKKMKIKTKNVKNDPKKSNMKNAIKIHNINITKVRSQKVICLYIKLIEGSKSLRLKMNKKIKSINSNGNNKRNTIEIINWNKGGAHISKKIDDIKHILEKHKPKIMVIN